MAEARTEVGAVVDWPAIDDLIAFARIELAANDLEPWALVIGAIGSISTEQRLWLIKLYNAFDDLGSACAAFDRWDTPHEWYTSLDARDIVEYPCTQERRNLRGGRIVQHLESYCTLLAGDTQQAWLSRPLTGRAIDDFGHLTAYLRRVWGAGRQSAFEWAEFLAKAGGFDLTAGDAQLWESEGPRRSLQKIFGNPTPTPAWLDDKAMALRALLHTHGVEMSWEDFETVICDFNVMRDGRYYPGRHLAALREEINGVTGSLRTRLDNAWDEVVPDPWCNIAPGIDPLKMPVYRDTGRLLDTP